LQTTSVRKATNDKAKEVHVVAREYKRQKVEQRRSCLKLVLGLQKDQGIKPKIKPQEHSTSEGNKGEEHILSPIKTNPNKLSFTFQITTTTSVTNCWNTLNSHNPNYASTATYTLPPPQLQVANPLPNPNPRSIKFVYIPYFLGKIGANLETHNAKFEITSAADDIVPC